jgi:hypothetical protein
MNTLVEAEVAALDGKPPCPVQVSVNLAAEGIILVLGMLVSLEVLS